MLYTVQDPSTGNGVTHSGQIFPYLNMIKMGLQRALAALPEDPEFLHSTPVPEDPTPSLVGYKSNISTANPLYPK